MPLIFKRVNFVSFFNNLREFMSVLIKVSRLIFGDFIFKFHDDEVFTWDLFKWRVTVSGELMFLEIYGNFDITNTVILLL